jgi:hypothetical protein
VGRAVALKRRLRTNLPAARAAAMLGASRATPSDLVNGKAARSARDGAADRRALPERYDLHARA